MSATRLRAALIFACVLATAAASGCGNNGNGGAQTKTPPAPPATGPSTTPPTTTAAPANGTAAPAPTKLPSYWIATDIADNWPGKRWQNIDLFTFIKDRPKDLDTGTRYVIFFGRTCEHCEEMFNTDLVTNPSLAAQVTAIEVPVESGKLRGDDAWPLPDTACNFGQLRLGPNWIMTTPVTVRLENGVVQCAEEGGHRACMGLE